MADEGIKRLIELGVNATPAIEELRKLNKATQEQTESLDGLQGGLAKLAEGAVSAFQALAVADLAKQFVDGVKQMIEEMDQLGKSAQVVGVNVGKLQELQYGLKLGAGLDEAAATGALQRFGDKLADIGNKTSDASRILREMGITANDDVATALDKLADRFANAPDGINKTAVATELFGRNLAQKMIPYLNGGSQGIADMAKELHQLGGRFDDDVSKQAAEFDDNLTKLAQHSKALGVSITKDLLPALVEVSGMLVQAAKAGNLWDSIMKRFHENQQDQGTIMKRWFGIDAGATNAEIRATNDSFLALNATMEANRAAAARAASTEALPAAHVANVKSAGKAAAQAASDFEKWMDAMLKAGQADKDLPAKIDWLERGLAALAKAGDTSSEAFKKWSAELLKLRPDAVASELLKLADAAKKLDEATSDKMLQGLEDQLAALEKNGPVATAQVKLLHAEILKIKADSGDVLAQFTLDLEKNNLEVQKNAALWEEVNRQLAANEISVAQYSELAVKYLPKVTQHTKEVKDQTNDLGKAMADAGAKFSTDFVDRLIDGLGKTKTSFADTITDMVKQLAKLIVQLQIAKAFTDTSKGGGGLGSLIGGLFGAAKGAAFESPAIQYMATGGILSSPTFFANGGRLAVAGEAGPEAVVPLQRSASGDLGVAASPVTVNVMNNADAKVTTATKDNEDGSRQIDIYIERKVKQLMNDGTMDRTMRSSYGVSRQPAAG